MKKSIINFLFTFAFLALYTSSYAGGPPAIYPSTSNSNGMTPQETLEISGKLKLTNVSSAQHPQDKMIVIGPDNVIKKRPIPPLVVKGGGGPPSIGSWLVNGGSTVWTNRRVGIGTNSPSEDLEVVGNVNVTGRLKVGTNSVYIESLGPLGNAIENHMYTTTGLGGKSDLLIQSPNVNACCSPANPDYNTILNANDNTGNVGIGLNDPQAKLDVLGGVLFQGSVGSTPVSGAGNRMMWIPDKASFRAGQVTGAEWDNSNIGDFSVAMGQNTKANGYASIAMGNGCEASGLSSISIGYGNLANGNGALAMGSGTTASGQISTALGFYNTASNAYSTALGNTTTASGLHSTSTGHNTIAQSRSSLVVGQYNVAIGDIQADLGTNALFIVGNGADNANRSNAFVVRRDGNAGIGTSTPQGKLDILGQGDGTTLLRFSTERPWSFKQTGAGPASRLDLHSLVDWKTFQITSPNGTRAAEYLVGDAANTSQVHLVPDGGRVGVGTANPTALFDVDGGNTHLSYYLRMKDYDLESGFAQVISRDGNWMFWNGGVVVGQFANNAIGNVGTDNLVVKGKVGIGTASPIYTLDVSGTGKQIIHVSAPSTSDQAGIRFDRIGDGDHAWIFLENYGASGTASELNRLVFETGNDGNADYSVFRNTHYSAGSKDVMAVHRSKVTIDATLGIGTTTPNAAYKLDVAGKVRACEVVVELSGWCDYVFEDDYQLMPLNELEQYLKKNKHLPNIPPAAEMEEEGVALAEMNVRMMEKIEELTLYLIELKKDNDEIRVELETLKK